MSEFVESEHPRDDKGRFTEKYNQMKSKTTIVDGVSSAVDLIKQNEEEYYKKIKKEYENSTNQELLDYIYSQLERPRPKEKFEISSANKNQIKDLKNLLGIDITGFKNVLDYNAIIHIKKRHGINGKADKSMCDQKDLARIGYILENYDSISKLIKNGKDVFSQQQNKDGTRANIVIYKKRINGYYITSQAVVDSKNKRLSIETAYRTNK